MKLRQFLLLFIFSYVQVKAEILSFDQKLEKNDLSVNKINTSFHSDFNKIFPGYKVYAYCSGSFKEDAEFEYALGIINPITKDMRYVVVYYNNQNILSSLTIRSAKLTAENEKIGIGPHIICESAMGIKRLNKIIDNPGEGIHGQIQPINFFDSFCITEPNVDTDHTCYSYDHKKNKFVSIGGWVT
jgi:hypothetical protein